MEHPLPVAKAPPAAGNRKDDAALMSSVGKHVMIKGIECKRASKVRIRTSGPLWVHTDGEVHRKSKDFTVETLPDKLMLLK